MELEQHAKLEWYWAQLAYEVFRANTQIDFVSRNSARVKDFLMEFKVETALTSEEDKAKRAREQMMNAKLFFSCLTGVGMEPLANGQSEVSKQNEKPEGDGRPAPEV